MKRRITTVLVLAIALASGGSAANALGGSRPEAGGYWGCFGVYASDHGVCLKNPLPAIPPLPGL